MAVPLIDFSRQYAYLKSDLEAAALKVLEHGRFILGPEVTELEEEVARLSGCKHGIGVASGTDALLVALRAAGVGPGDEVVTTDFSFFATAGVVARLGAKPVFCDIELDTYNMDPTQLPDLITGKTKAIMPVHLFGQVADMDPIMEIANKHDIPIVEDAAQAIGSEYKGRKAGSMGDYGCFSFYPTKNLGAAGDAGIITTNNDGNADRCRMLRVHGQSGKYEHRLVGYNSRLDTMQAAILLAKLPHLQKWSEARQKHAKRYDDAFAGVENIRTPVVRDYSTFHIYNQYTLASPKRREILHGLDEAQIGYCVYYPIPFHKQECFKSLGYDAVEFPQSNKAADEVFSIPIYPELTGKEQDEVIETIIKLAGA
jgi:dTDP-4-amino-4,6-dideoxygalactose transaminase